MTRLTVYQRQAFVRAVMDDVPVIDYDEQARALVQKWAVGKMPPKVRAIYKDDPAWISTTNIDLPGRLNQVCVHTNLGYGELRDAFKADDAAWHAVCTLAEKKKSEAETRDALRSKIKNVIATCSTIKVAHERLPEFAKYLTPVAPPVDRTVPVIANLVADLTAAGWPANA